MDAYQNLRRSIHCDEGKLATMPEMWKNGEMKRNLLHDFDGLMVTIHSFISGSE